MQGYQSCGEVVNLGTIQEITEHSAVGMTEFYTHVVMEHKREALKGLDFYTGE